MAGFVKIEEAAGLAAERDEYLNIDDVDHLVKDDDHDRLDICRDPGTGGPVKFFLTV